MSTTEALIGFGANVGDCRQTLDLAMSFLKNADGISDITVSSYLETQPVGGPAGQPVFLNGAARVSTELRATQLHEVLIEVEQKLGRVRHERWGPRRVDLDLLLFGDEVIQSASLQVPHPRMSFRRFVLEPASEVAGDFIDPLTSCSVSHYLECLNNRLPIIQWHVGADRLADCLAELEQQSVELLLIADQRESDRKQILEWIQAAKNQRTKPWLLIQPDPTSGQELVDERPILTVVENTESLQANKVLQPYLVLGDADPKQAVIDIVAAMEAIEPRR